MIACIYCGHQNPPSTHPDNVITITCANCGKRTPTGREAIVRPRWEQCIQRKYPPVTAARAMALSNAIYSTAEARTNVIDITKTRRALVEEKSDEGFNGKGMIDGCLISGRVHGGYTDGHRGRLRGGVRQWHREPEILDLRRDPRLPWRDRCGRGQHRQRRLARQFRQRDDDVGLCAELDPRASRLQREPLVLSRQDAARGGALLEQVSRRPSGGHRPQPGRGPCGALCALVHLQDRDTAAVPDPVLAAALRQS